MNISASECTLKNDTKMDNCFDRLCLVITAIVVSSLLIFIVFFSKKMGISKGWDSFIFVCVYYYVMVIFLVNSDIELRKYLRKGKYLIVLISSISLIELAAFLLFHVRVLPLPQTLFPYVVGSLVLSMVNVALFEYITKLMRKGEEEDKQS
jgi:hypothetical protein